MKAIYWVTSSNFFKIIGEKKAIAYGTCHEFDDETIPCLPRLKLVRHKVASTAREEQPRIPQFSFGVGQKQTHVVSIFHGSVYDSACEVVQERTRSVLSSIGLGGILICLVIV